MGSALMKSVLRSMARKKVTTTRCSGQLLHRGRRRGNGQLLIHYILDKYLKTGKGMK